MNKRRQFIILVIFSLFIIFIISLNLFSSSSDFTQDKESEEGGPSSKALHTLPITDINGPFTLEYLYTKNDVDYLKVSDSSPQGRMNALHWIRENGLDPTDLNVQFEDFTNPLKYKDN
jgi:flagellar basal body-associated protein FliL